MVGAGHGGAGMGTRGCLGLSGPRSRPPPGRAAERALWELLSAAEFLWGKNVIAWGSSR